MKNSSIAILAFMLLNISIYAQAQTKTRAHKMYDTMMGFIMKRDYEEAIVRGDSMLLMATEDKDSLQIGFAFQSLASLNNSRGNYDKYDFYNQECLRIFELIKNYDQLSLTYSNMAGTQRQFGNIDKAFEYAQKAKSYLPLIDNTKATIFNSNILSLLFNRTGQLDSAIHYELNVIDLLSPTDSFRLSSGYSNLATSFKNIGNYNKQKEYLDLAYKYAQSQNSISTRAVANYKLSTYESEHGNPQGALDYAMTSLKYYKSSKRSRNLMNGYTAVANAYLKMNELALAQTYIDSVAYPEKEKNLEYLSSFLLSKLEITLQRNVDDKALVDQTVSVVENLNQLQPKLKLYSLLSSYYRNKNDYFKADEYNTQRFKILDSLTNNENIQIVNNLETKYESSKKQLEIENLNLSVSRQRTTLYGGGMAFLAISLLSLLLFRLYKKVNVQKEGLSKALGEKDILLREIHHRVKNNLQLVSSLLTLQSRSIDDKMALQAINEGKSRVRSMALIHQDLYNKENLTGINVKTYLIKLTKELFTTYNIDGNQISLDLQIDDLDLDVDTLVPLGLIINELITNSLKYAFENSKNGTLTVKLHENGNVLTLDVIDNGRGYDASKSKETSFGTTLVSALTEQLDGEIITKSDSGGTQITISFNDYSSKP